MLLATTNTNLALLPAGFTSKCQLLGLCTLWVFYIVFFVTNIATNLTEIEQQRESFKLPLPSRQDFVNWIAEDMNYLKNHLDTIENLFHVRGIITANHPGKVTNN